MSTELENKYKDTIDLPQTEFPMRGNGPVREPEIQAKWSSENIYQEVLALRKRQKADAFILHDGPPYLSSPNIHIGTALNKILKDIVIKYKTQRGYYTPYVPGYDSHGLPIENAVVQEIKGGREAVTVAELRELCKQFALNNLAGQEAKFKRLGVLGDWEHPYITLDPKFEAEQIRLFGEMSTKGFIYRGLRTVYWSYGAQTALADAEVEYNEEHVSTAIYVAFPLEPVRKAASASMLLDSEDSKFVDLLKDSRIVIWTTTPWTIPGNMAICLNKNIDYVIVKAIDNETQEDKGNFIIAKDLVENFAKETKLIITQNSESFKGSLLEGLVAIHPLFGRPSPIIFGEHVTTDAGTGCVHTAPGHGQEDFAVGKEYGLEIVCPVDGKGVYTKDAGVYDLRDRTILEKYTAKNASLKAKLESLGLSPSEKLPDARHASSEEPELTTSSMMVLRDEHNDVDGTLQMGLEGFHVIKQGNDLLLALLEDAGALLAANKLVHSYPYCWRSKTPLLYRATEQWFCSVDGFRTQALSEIDKVNWIPERGRNRIYTMVKERGDWCISRQRTWGVPIPALYNQADINEQGNPRAILDPLIIEHVAKIFATEGSSAWYTKEIKDLVPLDYLKANPNIELENLSREVDTMDVWFDSGSTHRSVVAINPVLCPSGKFSPVDLYLEGSDQHRGWFQSSLLTSVATNGVAPYKSVLTHGFVMDEKGRKMSKSLGNVVDPDTVIQNYGADILRLWVASVDYSIDIKVGDAMFKQLSDIYRNFRNTARYLLGNLNDFNPAIDMVDYEDLWQLDKLLLHRLQVLTERLTEAFDNYQFFKYYQLIQNFCSVDLSAFYFDIIKDRLYTHGTNSQSRRSAQVVLYHLLSSINRFLVPVLPHMAEDIFEYTPELIKAKYQIDRFVEGSTSVLLSNWPLVDDKLLDNILSSNWDRILEIRELVNKEIEILRKDKIIGKSLEAAVSIAAPQADYDLLKSIEKEIKAVFIVSDLSLTKAESLRIIASKFDGHKCVRCWKLFASNTLSNGICGVCAEAVANR